MAFIARDLMIQALPKRSAQKPPPMCPSPSRCGYPGSLCDICTAKPQPTDCLETMSDVCRPKPYRNMAVLRAGLRKMMAQPAKKRSGARRARPLGTAGSSR